MTIDRKENVILFPIHPSSWPTMYQIAVKIKEEGKFVPVIMLTSGIEGCRVLCEEAGVEWNLFDVNLNRSETVRRSVGSPGAAPAFSLKESFFQIFVKGYKHVAKFCRWLEKTSNNGVLLFSGYHVFRAIVEVPYYRKYQQIVCKLLDHYKPAAVLTYLDNSGGNLACLLKICSQRKIRIITPAAAFQHQDIPAVRRARFGHLLVGPGFPVVNRWIRHKLPNQCFRMHGKDILFYPAYEILGMRWAGVLPEYPWVRGQSYCDVVCVEDFHQKRRLASLGVAEDKVVVTGHIECDNLFEIAQRYQRAEFNKQYDFDDSKKTIILAVPQLYQEGYFKTWEDYIEELGFLIGMAVRTSQNVLLVLHPKMNRNDYQFLEERFSCRINHGKTSDAIPFGDIYVSAGSSTAFWAIICGLIVVDIVSFYGHPAEIFSYFESLIPVTSREEYAEMLKKMTQEDFFAAQKDKVLRDQKNYLLPLDGQNFKRYLSLLDNQPLKEEDYVRVTAEI